MTTDQPTKPRTVPLDRVDEMEETRAVRSRGLDREHAEGMVPFIADLPPIDVVALAGGRYGILAGYHRLEAHRLADRKQVKVVIHDLPVEEWFSFAVRSNTTHGLPLRPAERKAAARRMLEAGDRRSDRAIAADCGLDHKTVGKLRHPEADDDGGEYPHAEVRVGRDGKTYPVKATPPPTTAQSRVAALLDTIDEAFDDHDDDHDEVTAQVPPPMTIAEYADAVEAAATAPSPGPDDLDDVLDEPDERGFELIAATSRDLDHDLQALARKLLKVIETGVWRMFNTPTGRVVRHKRFSDFVTAKGLDGLNSDMRTVQAVCQAVPKAAVALNQLYEEIEPRCAETP
jgi:ParB-like chromosome segregation protein Spo0J